MACSTEAFDVELKKTTSLFGRSSKTTENKDNLEAKLATFVKQAESYKKNPQKSDETISIDDAVFYIEGAVNYMNAHEGNPYTNLYVDSMFVLLCTDSGQFEIDEVLNTYNVFYEFANSHMQAVNEKQKYLLLTDVSLRNQNKSDVELKITTIVAGGGITPMNNDHFTSEKFYGEDKKCDGTSTLFDAQYLLQSKINNRYSEPRAHYFTNVDYNFGHFDDFRADNDVEDNYNDYYLLFKYDISPEEMCLDVDELNFYMEGIDSEVIPELVPNNMRFRTCKIEDFSDDDPLLEIEHSIQVWFGEFHFGYPPF